VQASLVTLGSGTIQGNGTLTASSGYSVTNGLISASLGGGTLTEIGGSVTLGGSNSFGGVVLSGNGTLVAATNGALGGTNVTVNGGTLNLTNVSQSVAAVTLASGTITGSAGAILNGASFSVTNGLVGVSLGGGTLTQAGGGTMTLAASNSFASTVLNGGTLDLGANNALGTNLLSISGGTLNIGGYTNSFSQLNLGSGTISGSGTLSASTGFNLSNGVVNASLGGSGSVTMNGTGTVTLGAVNTYQGVTSVGPNVAVIVTTNGAFSTNTISTAQSITFTNNSSTITVSNTIAGNTTNATITQNGSGTLTLAASNNTYGGVTTVANGTISFGTGSTNATGAQSLGTNVQVNLGSANSTNVTTLLFTGTNATLAKNISALSSNAVDTIQIAGNSTLTLSGNLSKNGTILSLKGGSGSVFNLTGAITGSLANSDLIYDGATYNVSSSNSYNGPTYLIDGAVVNANAPNALPTASGPSAVYLDEHIDGTIYGSGTSVLNLGTNQTIASLGGLSGSSVNLNNHLLTFAATTAGANRFDGVISGSTGSLVMNGEGTQILSGANTYSGGTLITNGTLSAANASALGSGTVTLTGNGVLNLQSILNVTAFVWSSTNSTISLTNPGTSYLNVSNAVTLSGPINYFDLTGATLNSSASTIFEFAATNAFTTNNFGIIDGALSSNSFALSITNNGLYDLLQIALTTLPVPSGGTNTITNTVSYPSVTFGTNSTLNITQSGNLTIATNVEISNSSTVNVDGILSASNSVITDPGSNTLMGIGTINANVVNSGILYPVSLNSGLPGKMTINGSLTLNPSGTFAIGIAGPTQYSSVTVSGPATLAGQLSILPIGYALSFGQQFDIINASSISGGFSAITAPAGYRGRLLLTNNNTQANLVIAPASYTQVAQNQNQSNVATALNSFIPATSGDRLTVSTALDQLTAAQYPGALNAVQPTLYQSMSTIAFNLANAQNMELNQRLWGQRIAEGGGFAMSGFADSMPLLQENGGLDFKNPKHDAILQPGPDNRWGLFVDANGIFAQANSGNMLPGYNSESGGVTTGITFRVNPVISVGAYVGYEGSYNKYTGNNSTAVVSGSTLTDNSVRFGGFATYGHVDGRGFYINAMLGGAAHNYNVSRSINFPGINRTANSTPTAAELDSMLAAGYDFRKGKWTFGPIASAQFTGFAAAPFSETGAQSLDLNASGWNTASLLSSLGAHAAYTWQATHDLVVVPQISLSWQHEFMQNPYAINSSFGGSPSFSDLSNAPLRDFLYTGIGFTVQFKQIWNASIFYNAAAGNKDLQSQNIFFSLGFKF
jgi:autotransporter-associated beta strand protein